MTKQTENAKEILMLSYKVIRAVAKNTPTSFIDNDLSMLQLLALSMLAEGKLAMTDISKELNVKLPTATSLIDRLFIAGFVERVDDIKDRRKVLISLTKKGKKTLEATAKLKVEKIVLLLNELPDQDVDSLLSILRKLYKKFEKGEK